MSDFWESVGKQLKRGWGASTTVPLFLVLLFIAAFFFIRWSDVVSFLSLFSVLLHLHLLPCVYTSWFFFLFTENDYNMD